MDSPYTVTYNWGKGLIQRFGPGCFIVLVNCQEMVRRLKANLSILDHDTPTQHIHPQPTDVLVGKTITLQHRHLPKDEKHRWANQTQYRYVMEIRFVAVDLWIKRRKKLLVVIKGYGLWDT